MTRKNAAICGTNSRYNKGCRCDDCRAAHTAYSMHYRRSRGMQKPGNPVEHDGVIYPTQLAAAKALGVSPFKIHYHLNNYGDLSLIRAQHHGAGA